MSKVSISLMADLFKDRIKKLSPFMSKEVARYYLNGIYLSLKEGKLKAVATNGHILCEMSLDCTVNEGEKFEIILPKEAIAHLIKVIPSKGVLPLEMKVLEDGKFVEFNFVDFLYKTKTVDGTYPDYSKVIPEGKVQMREGMKSEYLMAALKALNKYPVDISVDDEAMAASSPHLLTSQEAEGIKCVIMPMRV